VKIKKNENDTMTYDYSINGVLIEPGQIEIVDLEGYKGIQLNVVNPTEFGICGYNISKSPQGTVTVTGTSDPLPSKYIIIPCTYMAEVSFSFTIFVCEIDGNKIYSHDPQVKNSIPP